MAYDSAPSRVRALERALAPSGWVVAVLLPGDSAEERAAKLAIIEAAKSKRRDTLTVWIGCGQAPAQDPTLAAPAASEAEPI
jgi:hypothetical protein